MKLLHKYIGKFNPMVDVPVNPNDQSLSIKSFVDLPIEVQHSILVRGIQYGDHGVSNPDTSYVPPMCRKGVTLAQLMNRYSQTDATIRNGLASHKADKIFRKSLESATATAASGIKNQ